MDIQRVLIHAGPGRHVLHAYPGMERRLLSGLRLKISSEDSVVVQVIDPMRPVTFCLRCLAPNVTWVSPGHRPSSLEESDDVTQAVRYADCL